MNARDEREVTWRSWVDGPKGTASAVMRGAINYGLRIETLGHDKRWFNEMYAFEVKGAAFKVRVFRDAIRRWARKPA